MHTDERALKAFGRELRRLRGETELTQQALARRVSQRGTTISDSHVSDIENGRATARPWLRKLLDEILESNGRLEQLWEELTGSGRQVWLHEVTERTHAADALFEYQPLVFPGYLQTQDYSYALVRYGAPWLSQEQVLSFAKARNDRAKRMAEAVSPVIWLIIDQSVLWRRYGSPRCNVANWRTWPSRSSVNASRFRCFRSGLRDMREPQDPGALSPLRTNPRWCTWNPRRRAASSRDRPISPEAVWCSLLYRGPPGTRRRHCKPSMTR